jgi:hypothetical protein
MHKTSSHSIQVQINFMQVRINSNSSSTRKTQELCPLDDLKTKDAAAARKQTSLILLIPNQPLSRQGKSLDYVLAYVVDKIMKKRRKTNRTLLVNLLW